MTIPYINFDGHCADAVALYQKAFGNRTLRMQRYGDFAQTPADREKVLHMEMQITDTGWISGWDSMSPYQKGDTVNIMVRMPEDEARAAWAVMAEEAQILMEFAVTEFDAAPMGSLRDRFGVIWTFTVMQDM